MRFFVFISAALIALISFACNEEALSYQKVVISVKIKEKGDFSAIDNVQIKMTNTASGVVYNTRCDDEGLAHLVVERGFYSVQAQYEYIDGAIQYMYNGRLDQIEVLSAKEEFQKVELFLDYSSKSAIVISEVYFAGCKGNKGENYMKDQYIALYNNTQETVYLDGLCIGTVAPAVASKPSSWMNATDMSLIPIAYMAWQFPGSGNDYPLLPGQEVMIANNAVNHQAGSYNHPNSVDLSHIDWAFWDPSLKHDINAGVKPLNMFWKHGTSSSYAIAVQGPTFVLFRFEDIAAGEFAKDPMNLQKEPGRPTSSSYFLMIPRETIIDCVDIVEALSNKNNKRVPASLDVEAVYMAAGRYSGRALRRRFVGTNNGDIQMQDTNNSFADFEEVIPSLKK
ncbi:MAG: DUF4876 domain-containing protein [Tannerellaceae bacterium]